MRQVLFILVLVMLSSCRTAPWSRDPAFAAAERLPLEVCEIEGTREPLLCGTFEVYENRKSREGRKIEIGVVVIPAQEERTTSSAWIEHVGGPRYSMVASAPSYARGGSLEWFRKHRDVVLVDPRGLHASGGLFCKALGYPRVLEEYYPPDRVRACREELEQRADLAQYSTLNAIDDYEDIRHWLGYEQWDVGGWSFGSRFMLTYIHRYPEAIRTASLFIPSILNFDRPLNYARFGQRAFDRLVDDCRADTDCNDRFPDVAADLEATLGNLDQGNTLLEFEDPYTREPVTRRLTRPVFAEVVWTALLENYAARQLPYLLSRTAQGDFRPFLDSFLSSTAPPEPEGHYFSVVCPEETSRLDRKVAEEASINTFVGSYVAEQYLDACDAWGLPIHPGHPIQPQQFNIPALIVTGALDPVTPPEYGEEIAGHFRDAVHISVPHMAHGTSGMENAGCIDKALADFVDAGATSAIDRSCVSSMRPPPFRLK